MQEYSKTKERPEIQMGSMESHMQFREVGRIRSTRATPPIKLEIARSHLNKFDDFVASACDDVYNRLVEASIASKKLEL